MDCPHFNQTSDCAEYCLFKVFITGKTFKHIQTHNIGVTHTAIKAVLNSDQTPDSVLSCAILYELCWQAPTTGVHWSELTDLSLGTKMNARRSLEQAC